MNIHLSAKIGVNLMRRKNHGEFARTDNNRDSFLAKEAYR
jgi:hypothetical protein